MIIALAQINFCVGDVAGNAEKIIKSIQSAKEQNAKMIIFSELALTGYPPEDLLFNKDLYSKIDQALADIKNYSHDCYVVLGFPEKINNTCFNAACVLYKGHRIATYHKQDLPNYGVFDEKRYFEKGNQPCVFDFMGMKTGLIICEDMWTSEPAKKTVMQGAECLIVINASPYDDRKYEKRLGILKQRIKENAVPIIYVNQIGGQDDLLFDGSSLVMNEQGDVCAKANAFEETILFCELETCRPIITTPIKREEELYRGLVLAIRDYVHKNGFKQVFLGLSGGIDSALTLVLAVDALGADKVTAVTMPSHFTAKMGIEDAYTMANLLHVTIKEIAIDPIFSEFLSALSSSFKNTNEDVTEQNIQARIRGTLLMALANKFHGLVLTTSNKSEVAVGYSTLYGDMAGGFAVLKDVYKTDVYRLSNYRNEMRVVIPQRVIERPPSAELAANQLDQDDLPSYEILDEILKLIIEENESCENLIQKGFDPALVSKILRLMKVNEYKRKQSPIGPRLTVRAFGKDWRFPVTKR